MATPWTACTSRRSSWHPTPDASLTVRTASLDIPTPRRGAWLDVPPAPRQRGAPSLRCVELRPEPPDLVAPKSQIRLIEELSDVLRRVVLGHLVGTCVGHRL